MRLLAGKRDHPGLHSSHRSTQVGGNRVNRDLKEFSLHLQTFSFGRESNPDLRTLYATDLPPAEGKLARVTRLRETTCKLLAPRIL